MHGVIARSGIFYDDDAKTFSVSVKRGCADAGVQIHTRHDDEVCPKRMQDRLKLSAGKSAKKALVNNCFCLARSQTLWTSVTGGLLDAARFIAHFPVRHAIVRAAANGAPDMNDRNSCRTAGREHICRRRHYSIRMWLNL